MGEIRSRDMIWEVSSQSVRSNEVRRSHQCSTGKGKWRMRRKLMGRAPRGKTRIRGEIKSRHASGKWSGEWRISLRGSSSFPVEILRYRSGMSKHFLEQGYLEASRCHQAFGTAKAMMDEKVIVIPASQLYAQQYESDA